MARARRTLDRKTLREQGEAAERKKKKKDDDLEDKDEEEEEDEDAEEEASGDDDGGDDDGDDDDDKPKKKKKAPAKKKAAEKKPAKPRTRAAKIVRMKMVWVVYSNSHQPLEEFPYPKKREAEAYLEKVTNDKKSGGPFFLQPLKKPMDKDEL